MTQPYPNQAQTIPDTVDEAATDIQLMVTLEFDHHRRGVLIPCDSIGTRKLGSNLRRQRAWLAVHFSFHEPRFWWPLEQHLTRFD